MCVCVCMLLRLDLGYSEFPLASFLLSLSNSHLEAPVASIKEAPEAATKPAACITPFRQSPQLFFLFFSFFSFLCYFYLFFWGGEFMEIPCLSSASLIVRSIAGTTTSRMCSPCREWRCSCDGLQHAVDSTGIRSTKNSVC